LPPIRSSLAVIGAILLPIGAVVFFSAIIADEVLRQRPGLSGMIVSGICLVGAAIESASLVCCLVWLYQTLRFVARDDDEFSPGFKMGLLFVPVFNLYWMFCVILGLSAAIRDELRYLAPTRFHNSGWVTGLIACVLMLIPYMQPFAVCMYIAWMLLANNALHRLIHYHKRLGAIASESRGETSEID
jgi:hypothetical protein